jgi:hypothetical protein
MDISITNGAAQVLVNDLLLLGPSETLYAQAAIEMSMPMQQLFGPGRNIVKLHFRPGDFASGQPSELRVRIGYDLARANFDAFSDRPLDPSSV